MIEDTPEIRKQREKVAQLQMSYATIFNTEHGQRVLADLKDRYGWSGDIERPSARVGARAEDVFLLEGMKEPVRHILAMMVGNVPSAEEKPKKALSNG